jgi:hypothetical protein
VDLFEPGSGSQVHDFNGGILQSGLFWTLPLPDDAVQISRDGRKLVLDVEEIDVIDSFSFGSLLSTPARLSVHVEWAATAPPVSRGRGSAVAPTDAAAFLARFAVAESTAAFSATELGFSFRSDQGVSTDRGFAQFGPERNGVFL